VFTDDVGVDISRIDLKVFAEQVAKSSGVQNRPGSHDPVFGKAGKLEGGVGHDVEGIGHDKQNAFAIVLCDVGNYLLHELKIPFSQIQA
jgi:hypothetical protein